MWAKLNGSRDLGNITFLSNFRPYHLFAHLLYKEGMYTYVYVRYL